MKNILALLIFVCSIQFYAQNKFKISGVVVGTSAYHGGINIDNRNLIATPYKNFKLYLVRYTSVDSIPKVLKDFSTNKKGEFSISLKSGKYGFVTDKDLRKGLVKGQCLPRDTIIYSSIEASDTWKSNLPCPFIIDTNSFKNLIITNHRDVYCIECP